MPTQTKWLESGSGELPGTSTTCRNSLGWCNTWHILCQTLRPIWGRYQPYKGTVTHSIGSPYINYVWIISNYWCAKCLYFSQWTRSPMIQYGSFAMPQHLALEPCTDKVRHGKPADLQVLCLKSSQQLNITTVYLRWKQ